jgi:hypothetical protein
VLYLQGWSGMKQTAVFNLQGWCECNILHNCKLEVESTIVVVTGKLKWVENNWLRGARHSGVIDSAVTKIGDYKVDFLGELKKALTHVSRAYGEFKNLVSGSL